MQILTFNMERDTGKKKLAGYEPYSDGTGANREVLLPVIINPAGIVLGGSSETTPYVHSDKGPPNVTSNSNHHNDTDDSYAIDSSVFAAANVYNTTNNIAEYAATTVGEPTNDTQFNNAKAGNSIVDNAIYDYVQTSTIDISAPTPAKFTTYASVVLTSTQYNVLPLDNNASDYSQTSAINSATPTLANMNAYASTSFTNPQDNGLPRDCSVSASDNLQAFTKAISEPVRANVLAYAAASTSTGDISTPTVANFALNDQDNVEPLITDNFNNSDEELLQLLLDEDTSYNKKAIRILDNIDIPDFVKRTMSRGRSFNNPISKVVDTKRIMAEELLTVANLLVDHHGDLATYHKTELDADVQKLIKNIRSIGRDSYTDIERQKRSAILADFIKTQEFLSNNQDIIISRADKGNIVIASKKDTIIKLRNEHLDVHIANGTYEIHNENQVVLKNRMENKWKIIWLSLGRHIIDNSGGNGSKTRAINIKESEVMKQYGCYIKA